MITHKKIKNDICTHILILSLLFLVSCVEQPPEIKSTANPSKLFVDAGCIELGYGGLNCSALGLEKQFGCDYIFSVSPLLGYLQPMDSLIRCDKHGLDEQHVTRSSGLLPVTHTYILLFNKEYKYLKTKEDVQSRFVPLTSPEEALSYLLIMDNERFTLSQERIKEEKENENQDILGTLEHSYAKSSGDGFDVLVYEREVFGCSNHPTSKVLYHVTKAGIVKMVKVEVVMQEKYMLCVD